MAALFTLMAGSLATAHAEFSNFPVENLPAVDSSSVSWADFDNDGRLDFLILGTTNSSGNGCIAQLWRNTGNGFTNVPVAGLPGVMFGSAEWADFDNDGRMDFLLVGTTNGIGTGAISQLWRNTGIGFANVTSVVTPGLPQISQGAIGWGDFNNDGHVDFAVAGFTSTGKVAQVWQNTGSIFTNATASIAPDLAPAAYGSIAVADFNNDSRLDFLLTGELTGGQQISQLWQNTPSGFVNQTGTLAPGLPGVVFGSASWGDFDGDGRLDFLISGETLIGQATEKITQIWRNTGTGFTNVPVAELSGFRYSASTWGDFNNDGKLDFLLTGVPTNGATSEIWLNSGSTFTNANAGLPGVYSSAAKSSAIADFDNDGSLDILLTGSKSGGGRLTELWRNFPLIANTPPPAPSNLSVTISNGFTQFSWSAPVDAISGTNLSFNLRIGTTPGGSDVVNPNADNATGFRRVPALGNAQIRTTAWLDLPPGTYYWSVQAVDEAYLGGAFAEESVAIVNPPVLSIARSGTNAIVSWQPAIAGWILQETSNLNPSHWTNSPSGSTNPATIPAVEATKYYRLFKP
jgi:hypothetical protein